MVLVGAWVLLAVIVTGTALGLFLLHRTPLGSWIRERIPDRPRRRLFLA
jgi:hypothetical protein